jgi:hypothetical protein
VSRPREEPTTVAEASGLPVITCRLIPPLDAGQDRLDIAITLREGDKVFSDTMRITQEEMRLPHSLAEVQEKHGVLRVAVPKWVQSELVTGLREIAEGAPVWLQLASPAGHLATIPWEWHLRTVLEGRPLLRAPYSAVPVIRNEGLEVAVCAVPGRDDASYKSADLTCSVVESIAQALPDDTRIHVFAIDADVREAVAHARGVVLHDPRETEANPLPDDEIEEPWLRWMLGAATAVPIDVVHFICPGYLTASYGAFDFRHAPLPDKEPSGAVTGTQLTRFLTAAGCCGLALTIPSSKAWPAGLRMLAHRVARLRPGPVLVHAPHHAKSTVESDAAAAWRVLFTDTGAPVPLSNGLSMYVHPEQVQAARQATHRGELVGKSLQQAVEQLTLAGTPAGKRLVESGAPVWLAANQRNLERWASAALTVAPEGDRDAAEQAAAKALQFVADVLSGATPGELS